MHLKSLDEEVAEMRRLITFPSMKSPADAKKAFAAYVAKNHGIDNLSSPEGKGFLKLFEKYTSIQDLLRYMGYK